MVQPAIGKELHHFDRLGSRDLTDRDIETYHRLLARPKGMISGEWTPRYMRDFWVPALLKRAAPNARILVLLRDPWTRLLSGIAHEGRALESKLRGPQATHLKAMIYNDAVERSLYARQLARLFEHFDRARVLVLQYERCIAEPATELEATYRFLGLDPAHVPPAGDELVGRSSGRPEVSAEFRAAALDSIRSDAQALPGLAPEIDLSLWPSCAALEPGGRTGGDSS